MRKDQNWYEQINLVNGFNVYFIFNQHSGWLFVLSVYTINGSKKKKKKKKKRKKKEKEENKFG